MKYIKEYAFWNKDSDIAEKLLKNMSDLKSDDIVKISEDVIGTYSYKFTIKGFNIEAKCDPVCCTIYIDGVEIDCSWNQGKKIYKKAQDIVNLKQKQEGEFIKKDARISL